MRVKALSRLYAQISGPLFGAQSTSDGQGFPGLNWRPATAFGLWPGPRRTVRFSGGVALHLDPVPRGTTR